MAGTLSRAEEMADSIPLGRKYSSLDLSPSGERGCLW